MVSPRRALIRGSSESLPIKFDPKRFRLNGRALDFTIEEAKRIRDWPALETAVEHKIEQQFKFVNWWRATVRSAGGKQAQAKAIVSDPKQLSEPAAKELTGIGKVQVTRMSHRLKDPEKYRRDLIHIGNIAAQLADPDNFRSEGTGNNEWYTPAQYIKAARAVLGKIDLDPASSEKAQKVVKAGIFYSRADDGLKQKWSGRVWLNPPYSPKEIAAFVDTLCIEFSERRVSAAIMLTHNYTDSGWFQKAAAQASNICFPSSRIRFLDPDGVPCSPTQGQAFFYFGKNTAKFKKHFSTFGLVVTT